MTKFQPLNRDFAARVRESFSEQLFMNMLDADLSVCLPGEVAIHMPYSPTLTQQDGFLHAGVVTALVDSACGYAAMTLMPEDAEVLSVEFKVNLLSPAVGEGFLAHAEVIKPGRTLTVCRGDLFAIQEDAEQKLVATMQATMITRRGE
jgi:uncharacterized protein (TIGR00369 family)